MAKKARKGKIEINKSKDDKKFVTITSPNGKKLMHSETLNSNTAVKKNIKAIKRVIKNAPVVNKTKSKKR